MRDAIRQRRVEPIVLLADRDEQGMPPEVEKHGQLDHEDREKRDEDGERAGARFEWSVDHDASAANNSAPSRR